MEFPFNVESVLPGRITIIESKDSDYILKIYDLDSDTNNHNEVNGSWTYTMSANAPWDNRIKKRKEDLENIIDKIGTASAKAQGLHSPITTMKKLIYSTQQKVYIIRDTSQPRAIIGMLKVGIKRLFVSDDLGAHHEVDPLCVLDFYVHESKQRCGFGHQLFDAMLLIEGLEPEKLAVDRPSLKCLSFLEKHYDLKNPSQQNNNFVIYPGFLLNRPIRRPPIFLYNGKVVQRTNPNAIKHKASSSNNNISDSLQSLHTTQVPLNAKEMKSKTYHSSTGNFLNWDNSESNLVSNPRRKFQESNLYTYRHTNNPSEKNWGVHEAMHSYSPNNPQQDSWTAHYNNCSLTPINTVPSCNQNKWNQLQSSWNILGVKPLHYSPLHKNV